MRDIFGPGSNVGERHVESYEDLEEKVSACRKLGMKIVLTSGSWDMLHVGHCRYFENAKMAIGDPDKTVLVIGVDSDAKVRRKKGQNRPVVPQKERLEMVCHTRHADLVVLKEDTDEKWKLIKTVRPDVLIASERTDYTEEEKAELSVYCGEVMVLKSQAETSTSAKIRLLVVGITQEFKESFLELSTNMKNNLDQFSEIIDRFGGGGHK
ncbi:MAG: adenylyltransferase/cytidyltransferase family protein [Candidatus Colwellbacteria bacterium]|nr:adenylyltransferase/cytidyltransferase family protein [Candidatus Colwellbacteria bacterium]